MITVTVYLSLALVAGLFAFFPSPYALNRDWAPMAEGVEKKIHDRSAIILRALNLITHVLTTGFMLFCIVLIAWDEIDHGETLTDKWAQLLVPISLGGGLVVVWRAHALAGAFGSILITWVLTKRFGKSNEELVGYTKDLLLPLAAIAALLFAWWAFNSLIEFVVRRIQYFLTSAFAVSFSIAFLDKGWRHYVGSANQVDQFWLPAAIALVLMVGMILVQEIYASTGIKWLVGLANHEIKPPHADSHVLDPVKD